MDGQRSIFLSCHFLPQHRHLLRPSLPCRRPDYRHGYLGYDNVHLHRLRSQFPGLSHNDPLYMDATHLNLVQHCRLVYVSFHLRHATSEDFPYCIPNPHGSPRFRTCLLDNHPLSYNCLYSPIPNSYVFSKMFQSNGSSCHPRDQVLEERCQWSSHVA